MLLDTNIIIELFKGNQQVRDYLVKTSDHSISSVTAMELFYGAIDKRESQQITKALLSFRMIHLNITASKEAVQLIDEYAKSHGLMIPDALIAATAITNELPLLTLNVKDFRFINRLTWTTIRNIA